MRWRWASAITFGLYSVAGRYERAIRALLPYAARVYGAAALWLLPAAALAWPARPGAVSAGRWAAIVALGLLPLALGHTLYNASLRRIPATTVNVIATQEVTGGRAAQLAAARHGPGAGTRSPGW